MLESQCAYKVKTSASVRAAAGKTGSVVGANEGCCVGSCESTELAQTRITNATVRLRTIVPWYYTSFGAQRAS